MRMLGQLVLFAAVITTVSTVPSVASTLPAARLLPPNYDSPFNYRTYGKGMPPVNKTGDYVADAKSFFERELKLKSKDYLVTGSVQTETFDCVWIKQIVKGQGVRFRVANVALNKMGDIIAFGSNFRGSDGYSEVAAPTAVVSLKDAIASAEVALGGTYVERPLETSYISDASGRLVWSYTLDIRTPDGNHWYKASVDASNGVVIDYKDLMCSSSYRVVDPHNRDITQGQVYQLISETEDYFGSTWHFQQDLKNLTTNTSGNNVIVHLSGRNRITAGQSRHPRKFDFDYSLSSDATSPINRNASLTNAFYLANIIHDIQYRYGFTETTFNFQSYNFGAGGKENDRIEISMQESEFGLASFMSPADGIPGEMKLGLWQKPGATEARDPAMANDIIAHELTHGTTNRMIGGGTADCLRTDESKALGEGWSDAFAMWLQHTNSSIPDIEMFTWPNNGKGARKQPYSIDTQKNTHRWSELQKLSEMHDVGEVWALFLYEIYAQLVKDFGWDPNSYYDPNSDSGNVVWLRLFMDSLLLLPCQPTYFHARDSWVQSDITRYNGIHVCAIWRGFAKRGFGCNAKGGFKEGEFVDDSTIPPECGTLEPALVVQA